MMLGYLARRFGSSLLTLFGLSLLAFFLIRLAPGDTAEAILGQRYTEQAAERIRQEHGLDRPLPIQYGLWLGRLARGDLGQTLQGRPVARAIRQALPVTLGLVAGSLGIALLVGVPLGLIAAWRANRVTDNALTFLAVLGVSVPNFWLGAMLILVFSLWLGWLPSMGGQGPASYVLPCLALGAAVAAVVARMTRTATLETLDQDYIRSARAKGVAPGRVLFKHALRNACLPVLTILGMQAGYLLGGSIVIEEVFTLNGLGSLVLQAVTGRDYPLLQACILLMGAGFLLINLLVDLASLWVDPRLTSSQGGGGA